ncbi:MAG: hypothetical protein IKL65_04970 [Bacilli bacterium]|nr:hypothetical protein [Bacilli bacterium]
MEMNNDIDFESLRQDLMDYFGTAMMYHPAAVIELSQVENATNNKLIELAIQNGFNLENYKEQKTKKY